MGKSKQLTDNEATELLKILKTRFQKHMPRHASLSWDALETRLRQQPEKLWTLQQMEDTGGEPDVVGQDPKTGAYVFMDCALESPKGRRSLCYDHQALESRKEFKPANSALNMAAEMGIEILTEADYRQLQDLMPFDTKTSSWVATPAAIRKLGGAIFCDRRFDHVFMYHNGAESYYAARGFRGKVEV